MDVTELERLALSEEDGIQALAGGYRRAGRPSGVMASVSVDAAGPQLVQFIDRSTGEVVIQMAPESVLRLVEQLVDQLQHRSRDDELTGLPNRASAVQQLASLLDPERAEGQTVAVLFCDVDDFKIVNDSVGHGAGDEVLRAMAQRVSATLRSEATLFRANGDELIVLVQGEGDEHTLTTLASRIVAAVEQPFGVHGREIFISMSVGFAVARSGEMDPDLLLRHADLALRQAKATGKGRAHAFDPSMLASILQRVEVETELRHAMESGHIVVHYQPKLDLRTDVIAGVEALVRWDHPVRGIVPPNDFIPVAEQCGLIWRLGQFVLVRACNEVRQWGEDLGRPLTVAVNVSPRQLSRPAFAKVVEGVLASSGLPAERLVLEITEGSLIGTAGATQTVLDEVKRLGVQLSIDDFGTGYSSLDRLRSFPVDEMKIDRSFVDGIGSVGGDTLITAMLGMAAAFGHRVVAEGVETDDQLAFLRQHDCDHVQGYLVSRPLTAEAIEVVLREARPVSLSTGARLRKAAVVRIAYRIVDVFSDRPLAGNALCVVLDPVAADLHQAIAREVNLSETTFPTVAGGHEYYDVRIYTPMEELPFAGHPTIGTAWTLGPQRWTQRSPGAEVTVTADARGAEMSAPAPTWTEVDAGPAVDALGLAGAEGAFVAEAGGIVHLVVPTTEPLDSVTPDLAAIAAVARVHGTTSVSPVRRLDDATLAVRAFCPTAGIGEDPGTGSLAGPAALLCRERWGMDVGITISQGVEMGRPCTITVNADRDDLRVGGAVSALAEGFFTLERLRS